MDMLLVILVLAIIAVALYFKDIKSEIYFIGILDIVFRLLHKFTILLDIKPVTKLIHKYIPSSLEAIINYYTSGILNTVIVWILFIIYCYFIHYLIKYLFKRK